MHCHKIDFQVLFLDKSLITETINSLLCYETNKCFLVPPKCDLSGFELVNNKQWIYDYPDLSQEPSFQKENRIYSDIVYSF
jgi:hypothetical protein